MLGDRPRREMRVRVREPRKDAAPAEVDRLGACERGLVHADAAGDPLSGDRKGSSLGQRRVEGADDAVLEDHRRRAYSGTDTTSRRPASTIAPCPGTS